MTRHHRVVPSPIGFLGLLACPEAVREIRFLDEPDEFGPPTGSVEGESTLLDQLQAELEAYFAGRLTTFQVAVRPEGTPFQRRVWQELQRTSFGETTSYGAIATRIGKPTASRAVGAANGRNPVPVVIPCHRVIGANGHLTGFGGGLERKRTLLHLERRFSLTPDSQVT